jgi:hypothetical protein
VAAVISGFIVQRIGENWIWAGLVSAAFLAIGLAIEGGSRLRSSLPSASSSTTGGGLLLLSLAGVLLLAIALVSGGYVGYNRASKEADTPEQPAPNPDVSIRRVEKLPVKGNELEVAGKVAGLATAETIWVANLPKADAARQHITQDTLEDAKVWPAFGPCKMMTEEDWSCDRVFYTPNEEYYILAYRVDSDAARFLVQYQIEGYATPFEQCKKEIEQCKKDPDAYNPTYPNVQLPHGAQLASFVEKAL